MKDIKMSKCYLCPRKCGADRAIGERGFCNEGDSVRIAKYSLHMWEEPPISGERGSGTVFFSGCSLRCEFCQNRSISRSDAKGENVSVSELISIMLQLEQMGAENINLVTPTHFADKIAKALEEIKSRLSIPVVYNSSGYENVQTLTMLDGLVDVYLPDFKYFSAELAAKYSHAPDYRECAERAITEMRRQVPTDVIDGRGIMQKGMIVRHLVLPSHRADSIMLLERLAQMLEPEKTLLSLMSQYTPEFAVDSPYRELHRRITTFEYGSVLSVAERLGFAGFRQQKSSADQKFTPDF